MTSSFEPDAAVDAAAAAAAAAGEIYWPCEPDSGHQSYMSDPPGAPHIQYINPKYLAATSCFIIIRLFKTGAAATNVFSQVCGSSCAVSRGYHEGSGRVMGLLIGEKDYGALLLRLV